jgi:hypothetical protein
MSYNAIVTKISTRPHPNADKLKLGTCFGNQVVIGLETEDGELGLFFPTDGQLSEEFAKANDLIRRKDPEGNKAGGMFEENRRIRSQKFRGEKSDGFWCPISYLDYLSLDISFLKEGDTLSEIKGKPICNKYYSKATLRSIKEKKVKISRGETKMFKKHMDTEQFRFVSRKIPNEAVITVTHKLHGTSQRISYGLDTRPLKWYEKIYKYFKRDYDPLAWKELVGSRNVILEKSTGKGWYGDDTFRYEANKPFEGNLRKGETVYYEIVGWVNETMPIMGKHQTDKTKDPTVGKKYGDEITYTYGCLPGERDIYVYRITLANEDGYTIDYSWDQVKNRCKELGVKYVPEVDVNWVNKPLRGQIEGSHQALVEFVEANTEGEDTIDPRHPREGVVVRVDCFGITHFYKNKSFLFGVLEGYAKDKDDYVDAEEVS